MEREENAAKTPEPRRHKKVSLQKAQKKYDAEYTKMVPLKLNTRTDADIIEKLTDTENKQGYIKNLIRQDIEQGEQGRNWL